jgi:hypothetical protein
MAKMSLPNQLRKFIKSSKESNTPMTRKEIAKTSAKKKAKAKKAPKKKTKKSAKKARSSKKK